MAPAETLQTALDNVAMTGASLNSLTSFLDLVYLRSSGCLAGRSNDGGRRALHGGSSSEDVRARFETHGDEERETSGY